jgi:hypothetical protein
MTKCDGCGKEVGTLYCGKCRDKIRKKGISKEIQDKLIPLLYWNPINKTYVIGCTVTGCPCNTNGFCSGEIIDINQLKIILHEFDGDNCVHQFCG